MNGTLLSVTIPVFLTLGAGFLMRWNRWLSEGIETGLMRLAIVLLMPCLILDKVIGDPALNKPANLALAIGLGFGIIVLCLLLASGLATLLGLSKGQGRRTFALTCAVQNYGFLAVPVLVSLFGERPLGVLFIHSMGVELAVWTAGIMTLQGLGSCTWRSFLNGPSVALVLGLLLHYTRGDEWMPAAIRTVFATFGQCAIPMSLFSIGATIAAELRSTTLKLHTGTLVGAVLCRLVLFPVLMLWLTSILPTSKELRMVMVVQAAMPSAVVPVILARLYGGHPLTAVQVIVITTALSIFTMPFALALGQKWLGL